jgi:GNAT superfamily N-acetyltransferase
MEADNYPAIPGIVFRHFQGDADHARIAAVLTASEQADQMVRSVTGSDIAAAYQHLTNCDPYTDLVIAEANGEVIGFARGWWENDSPTGRLYKHNAFLQPAWRRKGVGRALLGWVERRLGDISASHPPEEAKFYQANVTQFQDGAAVLLERAGYQVTRYYYLMVRPTLDDISILPLPDGLEVRPVLPDHYRPIWNLVDETSQDEWGYQQTTEADYQEWLESPQFQPDLWQIAWDTLTDQPVGTVLTYIYFDENRQFNRLRGYTEGIGVRRAWRRRGVARALIGRSLLAQKAAGMTESALVADSDSQSNVTQLYQGCGFQIVKRDTIYRKPLVRS